MNWTKVLSLLCSNNGLTWNGRSSPTPDHRRTQLVQVNVSHASHVFHWPIKFQTQLWLGVTWRGTPVANGDRNGNIIHRQQFQCVRVRVCACVRAFSQHTVVAQLFHLQSTVDFHGIPVSPVRPTKTLAAFRSRQKKTEKKQAWIPRLMNAAILYKSFVHRLLWLY